MRQTKHSGHFRRFSNDDLPIFASHGLSAQCCRTQATNPDTIGARRPNFSQAVDQRKVGTQHGPTISGHRHPQSNKPPLQILSSNWFKRPKSDTPMASEASLKLKEYGFTVDAFSNGSDQFWFIYEAQNGRGHGALAIRCGEATEVVLQAPHAILINGLGPLSVIYLRPTSSEWPCGTPLTGTEHTPNRQKQMIIIQLMSLTTQTVFFIKSHWNC